MSSTAASPSAGETTGGDGRAVLDFDALEGEVARLHGAYACADPYPHIVLDDVLDPEVARRAMKEFPALDLDQWNNFIHVNERKHSNTSPDAWGPALRSVLDTFQSPRFVAFLSALTGIEDLCIDDTLMGGGLHETTSGGYLNIHTDFTVHPRRRTWRRRINLLLYLNEDWAPEYGGDLEMWSADVKHCVRRVSPVGNRVVIFTTDTRSYHGHPEPLTCPPGMSRRSLALYYFTEEDHPLVRATDYRARPGDGVRGLVIFLDKQLLRAYDWLKRRLGISDHTAGTILRKMDALLGRRQR
ncbi:MAG TPA: 2OG-Fe(II) oxygenase [Acidimicrobiales bacterium]|nr:2OG-Fe(II) oxygenase [Acidimicrobiales bacterium]